MNKDILDASIRMWATNQIASSKLLAVYFITARAGFRHVWERENRLNRLTKTIFLPEEPGNLSSFARKLYCDIVLSI